VVDGTYTATVYPPSESPLNEQTTSQFMVSGTSETTEDIALSGPTPPPPGTVLSGVGEQMIGGQEFPVINWSVTSPISTAACPGGTVSVTITGENTETGFTQTTSPVTLTEIPADSGTFVGSLPAVYPIHGPGTVTISITNCSDPSQDGTVDFTIYIDPSGTVVDADHGDAPVPGATVTLLSSDSLTGTFTPVVNGSAVMSPGNRSNPDTTGADGNFGWDTIPGFYRVQATMAGCGTTTTPAFQVPPAIENLQLVLHCASGLAITSTPHLPGGTTGQRYSTTLSATGGSPPYTWRLAAGSSPLPKGLELHEHTGVISGKPKNSDRGTYTFTVEVLDKKILTKGHAAKRNSATRTLSISIS
jgi:hypothetical protein